MHDSSLPNYFKFLRFTVDQFSILRCTFKCYSKHIRSSYECIIGIKFIRNRLPKRTSINLKENLASSVLQYSAFLLIGCILTFIGSIKKGLRL